MSKYAELKKFEDEQELMLRLQDAEYQLAEFAQNKFSYRDYLEFDKLQSDFVCALESLRKWREENGVQGYDE